MAIRLINDNLERRFREVLRRDNKRMHEVLTEIINTYIDSADRIYNIAHPEENINQQQRYLALERICGVARNQNQINHWILKSYFCTEHDGVASLNEMKNYFLKKNRRGFNEGQFQNNFIQMLTDDGNPHGHYFDVRGIYGDKVELFGPVRDGILRYRHYFIY